MQTQVLVLLLLAIKIVAGTTEAEGPCCQSEEKLHTILVSGELAAAPATTPPHFTCLIALLGYIASATAQSTTTTLRNSPQPLDARGRYNPYYNDPYYQNRFFRNRDYYNRQYYDNLFKKYNPDILAPQARIIAHNVEQKHDGTYTYSYETENGIQAEERGVAVKVGTEEQKEVVEGSYSYVSPDGMRVIVKYTADENGYHPTITYDGINAERFTRLQQPADIVITRQN